MIIAMARPLLPPRGALIPTRMLYHSPLTPRCGLAWGGQVTPPLRMQELTELTGKRQAMLYKHMSLLRPMPACSWRSTGQGTIIVSFAAMPSAVPFNLASPLPYSGFSDSRIQESRIQESSSLLINQDDL